MKGRSHAQSRPRTSSGILWAGISQGGRVAIQFLGLVVLSRLLPASDFGVVALASIVTNFALLLRDMGTSVAVIQREELNEGLLDTIFWFNVAIGLILGLAVVLISFPASLVFAEPKLQGVLMALAISFPLGSLAAIHQALLERGFRFPALARIELTSSVLGLAGGMFAAWKGAGAYSLVLTTILTVSISSLLLWIVSPWRPGLRWSSSEFRSLRGFSDHLVAFQVVNYFSRNADTMLIGRFLGSESLGVYNMAYKLMLFPVQNLSTVIGRALLPVLSRTQNEHATLRGIYLNAISTIAMITCPLMIGLWVLREPFVLAVLGNEWVAVPAILAWLAPVGLAQSLVSPVGLLYIATGRTDVMLKTGTFVTSVTVLGMLIGLSRGNVGVAAGYAIANLLIMVPCAVIPFRLIGLRFRDFVRAIAAPLTASIAMGVAVWGTLAVWKIDRQAPALQLGALVVLGVALFMSMAVLFMRAAIMQVVSIMKDSIKGLPVIGEFARRVYRRYLMQDPSPFTGSGNYWESRYATDGDSGVGSYGKFAAFKAEILNAFVAQHGVSSVIEFGCGDGNQLKLARYPRYTGFDVSRTAVERCSRLFAGDASKSFALTSSYRDEQADLVLSLDVIFHLVEDDVFEKYMRNLFLASRRYVIIYSSNFNEDSPPNGLHVKHRKFSDWILKNCPTWRLLESIPNKYPYHGDNHEGSFADFFVYERVES
jgi:O-antigen/teichoic acid export membrane protein